MSREHNVGSIEDNLQKYLTTYLAAKRA